MSTATQEVWANRQRNFGRIVGGPSDGKWKQFGGRGTSQPVIYRSGGESFVALYDQAPGNAGGIDEVHFRIETMTPVAGGRHFWLTEIGRERYDGVL